MINLLLAEIFFKGGYLEYFPQEGLIVLYDSAYIRTSEGVELYADTVRYWKELNVIEARGKFLLKDRESQTTGEYLKYNINTGTGIAKKSRTFIEKGWVEGEVVYKTSENSVYVEDGSFTTCELERPHYRFVSNRMRVLRKDLAVVRPLIFYIMDLPIVALPFWFLPVGKERSSGFLPPSVGVSSQDGKYIRGLSFYLVINSYQDVTFSADIIERRGVRFSSDYVYHIYKTLKGNINISYAYDLVGDKGYRRRWSLRGGHEQSLFGFDISAKGDFISDAYYVQDYAEVKDNWVQSELVSFLTARRRLRFGLLGINLYNRFDPLRNRTERRIPEASLSLLPLNLLGFSLSSSFNFLNTENIDSSGKKGYKLLSSSHNISTSYNLIFLSFSPSAYLNSATTDSTNFAKVWGINLPLSTTLYGVSLFGIGSIKRFRHILRPSISFFYQARGDSIIIGGNRTVLGQESKGLNISIDNTYEYKIQRDTLVRKGTFLQWGASTNYIFDSARISPIRLNSNFTPINRVSASIISNYNHYSKRFFGTQIILNFGSFNLNEIFGIKPQRDTLKDTINQPQIQPWNFGFTYTYSFGDSISKSQSILRFYISGNPTKNWAISYNFTYDLLSKRFLDQSLNLRRDLHCWVLEGRWSWFGGISVYDVRIYVKAIPEIAIRRGFLDILLPR
ncbi:MAG: putative LPS assembly protein LptD [Candidatus Caldipriscus sp.]|nr:putative LPS assembly protein LptD [Candidatus Caldipriscus sp.]